MAAPTLGRPLAGCAFPTADQPILGLVRFLSGWYFNAKPLYAFLICRQRGPPQEREPPIASPAERAANKCIRAILRASVEAAAAHLISAGGCGQIQRPVRVPPAFHVAGEKNSQREAVWQSGSLMAYVRAVSSSRTHTTVTALARGCMPLTHVCVRPALLPRHISW